MNTAEKEAAIKILEQFDPMATIANCIKKLNTELSLEYFQQGAQKRVGLDNETFRAACMEIGQAFITKHAITPPDGFYDWFSKRLSSVVQYCARNGYNKEATLREMKKHSDKGDTLIAFKLIFID